MYEEGHTSCDRCDHDHGDFEKRTAPNGEELDCCEHCVRELDNGDEW